jgi:hypothetical protein
VKFWKLWQDSILAATTVMSCHATHYGCIVIDIDHCHVRCWQSASVPVNTHPEVLSKQTASLTICIGSTSAQTSRPRRGPAPAHVLEALPPHLLLSLLLLLLLMTALVHTAAPAAAASAQGSAAPQK